MLFKKKKNYSKKNLFSDENPQSRTLYCSSKRRRDNLQILFSNTTVWPFKWHGELVCFHCDIHYNDYSEFKKHTKSHNLCINEDISLKSLIGKHTEIYVDSSEISCEICYEPFDKINEVIDHLIIKHDLVYDKSIDIPIQGYKLKDSKCHFCEESFANFEELLNHINTVHPQNNCICNDCGLIFNRKKNLAKHLLDCHRQGGYSCVECNEIFESNNLLKNHKNSFHFRKCKSCELSFGSFSLLKSHMKSEHSLGKNRKCANCSKQLLTSQGFNKHVNKCKVNTDSISNEIFVQEDTNVTPKRKQNVLQIRQNILCVLNMSSAIPFKFFSKFSCFYCSKKFVEFEELKSHTTLEHPVCDLKSKCIKKCKGERITVKIDISSLTCKLCSLFIDNLDSLIDHLITKHDAKYDKEITGCLQPFKIIKDNIPCPSCPNAFRYFGILLRHINSEHSNNNKICDFCGRSFKNVSNLKVHIAYTHTGSSECEICGSKYKNQWCLGRHRAKCHNAKDYKCPKCPEQFQSQYHKQKHLIKVHDIGHKCSYCGKMFTRNSFMKDHIRRTHLKEKNVPCSVCNERFFDNYLLRMHMVKHEGERKFNCDVCGKAFLRRSNLSSHMEMHKKYGHVTSLI